MKTVKRERRFDRAKDAKWRAVMQQFAKSELSVREFCRRNEIREPSFYSSRRAIQERDRQADLDYAAVNGQPLSALRVPGSSSPDSQTGFASVAVIPPPVECGDLAPAMKIVFGCGIHVSVFCLAKKVGAIKF